MIDDILQKLLHAKQGYYTCWNCELSYCMNYINKNKICSGVVKDTSEGLSFDVIRLCIKTTDEPIQTYDYSPDEASSVISVLSQSLGDWLSGTKQYQLFRNNTDCVVV